MQHFKPFSLPIYNQNPEPLLKCQIHALKTAGWHNHFTAKIQNQTEKKVTILPEGFESYLKLNPLLLVAVLQIQVNPAQIPKGVKWLEDHMLSTRIKWTPIPKQMDFAFLFFFGKLSLP